MRVAPRVESIVGTLNKPSLTIPILVDSKNPFFQNFYIPLFAVPGTTCPPVTGRKPWPGTRSDTPFAFWGKDPYRLTVTCTPDLDCAGWPEPTQHYSGSRGNTFARPVEFSHTKTIRSIGIEQCRGSYVVCSD